MMIVLLGFSALVSFFIGFMAIFAYLEDACSGKTLVFIIATFLASCFMFVYPQIKIDEIEFERPEPYVTHELIALADKHSINGRIHLRRGIVNEVYQYTYAYKLPNGGMKTQRADNDITIVYFTDDIPPCAKWYKETREFWYYKQSKYVCEIFIPTDALVADYSIDLQ